MNELYVTQSRDLKAISALSKDLDKEKVVLEFTSVSA